MLKRVLNRTRIMVDESRMKRRSRLNHVVVETNAAGHVSLHNGVVGQLKKVRWTVVIVGHWKVALKGLERGIK